MKINCELYQASKCYSFPPSCSDLHKAELPNCPHAALQESAKSCTFSHNITGVTALKRTCISGALVDNASSGLWQCQRPPWYDSWSRTAIFRRWFLIWITQTGSLEEWFACYCEWLQEYMISSAWRELWGGHLDQPLVHSECRQCCWGFSWPGRSWRP